MNQESVIQSKSETENQISHINTYLWNPENGADDPISRVDRDADAEKKRGHSWEGEGGAS